MTDYRSGRRTLDAHGGQPQLSENEEGIQHNIDESADDLSAHGKKHISFCLQNLGTVCLQEHPQGKEEDNPGILRCIKPDRGLAGGEAAVAFQKQYACGGKKKKIEDTETEAASYRVILRFLFPSAVHPGYQDIDSGAGTGGNGGHQQLQGKNKGQGRQPVKGVLGHKVAVHNIVDGLDQQGQHDGRA